MKTLKTLSDIVAFEIWDFCHTQSYESTTKELNRFREESDMPIGYRAYLIQDMVWANTSNTVAIHIIAQMREDINKNEQTR
jgi:hypothetical protein